MERRSWRKEVGEPQAWTGTSTVLGSSSIDSAMREPHEYILGSSTKPSTMQNFHIPLLPLEIVGDVYSSRLLLST